MLQTRFDFRILYPIQISFVLFIVCLNKNNVSWLGLFVRYRYLVIFLTNTYVRMFLYNIVIHEDISIFFNYYFLCIKRDLILEYYIQSKSCLFSLSYGPIKIMIVGWFFLIATDISLSYCFDL